MYYTTQKPDTQEICYGEHNGKVYTHKKKGDTQNAVSLTQLVQITKPGTQNVLPHTQEVQ